MAISFASSTFFSYPELQGFIGIYEHDDGKGA
jgi:hypothetical protein